MNPQNMFRKPRWEFTMYLLLIPFVLSQTDEEMNRIPIEQLLCPEVQGSISIVTRCPGDEAEWLTTENSKNCSKPTKDCPDELVYHCVPNHYQNVTVEVCAPLRLIVFGYCVEYSFPGRIVQENYNIGCTQFTVPCPTYYKSNEVYKYQGCYNAFKSTVQHPWDGDKERINWVIDSQNVPKSKKKADEEPDKLRILGLSFGVILLALWILLALPFVWKWSYNIKRIYRPCKSEDKFIHHKLRKKLSSKLQRHNEMFN